MTDPAIYTDAYYRKIHALEERHWWHLGMRRIAAALVRSALGDERPERALDAGCGTGNNVRWLREALGARAAFGLDIAFEGVAIGAAAGVGPLVQGSVTALPFAAQSFDFVLSEDVLQHLPAAEGELAALAEMRRVLRPGGRLLLRANSRLGMGARGALQDHDYRRYTLAEVAARAAKAGLAVERATYANCLPSLYAMLRERLRPAGPGHDHHGHEGHGHDHHGHDDHGPHRHDAGAGPGGEAAYTGHRVRDTAARAPRLNAVLKAVMAAEAAYLARPGRTLPFGHTTFCLARRPGA